MDLRVAFVHGAVLPLDLEKEVLHFAERAAINGRGEFFDYCARPLALRRPSSRETNCEFRFSREILALRGDGRFQIANALIKLLQTDGVRQSACCAMRPSGNDSTAAKR